MISFPNAKLNIGLRVTGVRPDGFRNLESCFYPVQWCDALEILPAEKTTLRLSGIPVPGDETTNLCLKAYELLKENHKLPPIGLHLHKHIPIGAGMGGGSADAAFTLKMLNELFALDLPVTELEEYARKLGSDCAFFIRNKAVMALEKGDVFEPINLDLTGFFCLVVYPDLHITTAEAYRSVKPNKPESDLKPLLEQDISTWKTTVINDFEAALFPLYPVLPALKESLYDMGAVYASMTGSGSAVYGIFKTEVSQDELHFPLNYRIWQGSL